MAIIEKKISEIYSGRDISSLSDRPNEDGMTATQLKARFDQLGKEVIPNFNDLIDELNGIFNDTAQRIDNLVVTPVPVGEIIAQEIIEARQGALSLGGNITEVKSQLADKASKTELNSVASGTPRTTYPTLALLNVGKPTGDIYSYVTSDGIRYWWDGSAWIDGGLYQSTGLADGSVTTDKTDFATPGKNLFDKNKRVLSMFMPYTNGILGANAVCDVSDYIKIFANQSYTINKARTYCLFGTDKVYITGVDGGGFRMTFTPTQDGYMRFTLYKTDVDSAQVEKGTVITAFEPYGTSIKNLSLNDKSISPLKLMDSVRFDAYPFQPLANFNANLTAELEIKKAIKIIELFGADKSKKYNLGIIQRNYQVFGTGAYIYECNADGSNNKIVALTSKTSYTIPSGIDIFSLAEYQSSGITAKLYVDWSQITDGTQYVNNHYDKAGLDYRTYTTEIELIIKLPPKIQAIVGKEFNIYFDNIMLCENIDNYSIEINDFSYGGVQQNERYTCIPTTTSAFTVQIFVYKDNKLLASAQTTVTPKAITVGDGVTKKCIFIGDSTIDSGGITGSLLAIFNDDVMNLELLGTRGLAPNLHEGRAGWRASNFVNNAISGGVVNAFYNNGFDFSYYMTQQAYIGVDVVGINLGINDVFSYTDDVTLFAEIDNIMTRLDIMKDSIKAYNSNTKVAFLITIPPSVNQDAFGKNYSSGQTQWRYKRNNFFFMSKLIEKYKAREAEGIYLIPINVNLDTTHNMLTEDVAVNSRNSQTIIRQSNGVHPAGSGNYQIADMVYYWLKSFEI